MEKKLLTLLLFFCLVMSFALSGCCKTEEAPAEEQYEISLHGMAEKMGIRL